MSTTSSLLAPPLQLPPTTTNRPYNHRRRLKTPSILMSNTTDPLTAIGRLLWGRALPPSPLISAVRSTWSATWHLMMRQLAPSSPNGSYSRPQSPFPSVPFPYPNPDPKFHLYAALPCPWAHRTLIVRALKSLETSVPVSIASPGLDGSWEFSTNDEGELLPGPDRANGRRTLREVYQSRRGGYDGRSTVPMLWDCDRREVVCNESYGIIEFFNLVGSGIDLCPAGAKGEIEEWMKIIYPNVNNGVYRCGFAQSQKAYDSAVGDLFSTLDILESKLSTTRYLCGDALTLADVCLFTTLIRFDLVYNVLFKCTKKKLVEYPNLYGYTCDIYQIPKVAETCNFDAIADGYYGALFPLNPGGIRPAKAFSCNFFKEHNREVLSSTSKDLIPAL